MGLCPSPLTGGRGTGGIPAFQLSEPILLWIRCARKSRGEREMRRPFANNVDQRQLGVRLQFVRFDIAAVPCAAFDNVTVIILWLNFTTQETERQSESRRGSDRDVGLCNSYSISFTRAGFSTVAVGESSSEMELGGELRFEFHSCRGATG